MSVVWDSTQENLETAVRSAYTGWNTFNARHVDPATHKIARWWARAPWEPCCPCLASRRPTRNNRRRSVDIFFDMYDEDDMYERDELDRLLENEEYGSDDYGDFQTGPHGVAVGVADEDFPSYRPGATSGSGAGSEAISTVAGNLAAAWYWLFPQLRSYDPGSADMIGVSPAGPGRSRSSTKSSVLSSDTLRSRRDLFSDDDLEDAQLMSDVAAVLSNARRPASSASGASATSPSGSGSGGGGGVGISNAASVASVLSPSESAVSIANAANAPNANTPTLANPASGRTGADTIPPDPQDSQVHPGDGAKLNSGTTSDHADSDSGPNSGTTSDRSAVSDAPTNHEL